MNKIKKIAPIALLLTGISSSAFADNWNLGASASYGNIDGTANDTQFTGNTSSGTGVAQTRGANSGDADFPFASIFVEYVKTMDKSLDLVVGLDYVPFKAEIDDKSFSDNDKRTGQTAGVDGTRTAKLELKNYDYIIDDELYSIYNSKCFFGRKFTKNCNLDTLFNIIKL